MTALRACPSLVSKCTPSYHEESRRIAMRANSYTAPAWEAKWSNMTTFSCIGCGHGMAFVERMGAVK